MAKLLREAANAIEEELQAAGEDEVKQHPTLRRKRKLVQKIDRFFGDTDSPDATTQQGGNDHAEKED